jgi:hypothetical protein
MTAIARPTPGVGFEYGNIVIDAITPAPARDALAEFVQPATTASVNKRRSHWCAGSLSMRGCQTWI